MMNETYTVPARFGVRALLLLTAIISVVFGVTTAVEAELRVVAPVLSFVVLVCCAQMFFGKIPRIASALVGAFVFPLSAAIDPLFDGERRLQPLLTIELFWLIVCGCIAGYLGGVLLAGLFLISDCVQRERKRVTYSVPRRFGMGTLLVAMTMFAIVYAFLNWANARPWHLFFFTTFVGTVSAGQMLMQRAPRWASILAGGLILPLSVFGFVPPGQQSRWQMEQSPFSTDAGFVLTLVVLGLLVGYLGGTLISGVFLLSDFFLKLIVVRPSAARQPLRPDEEPVGTGALTRLAEQMAASRRP